MITKRIIPCLDVKDGRVVKGTNFQNLSDVSSPIELGEYYSNCGADELVFYDITASSEGRKLFTDILREVAENVFIPLTVGGGGIREMKTVDAYLQNGVDRVILGTAAVTNETFLQEAVRAYGDRIAVGVDVKDGLVAIKGWRESSTYSCFDFCQKMVDLGVKYLICTDISKDGAMQGTNRELYRELSEKFPVNITASGGVSTLEDIRALFRMKLYGAIVGKAYYSGAITLADALEAAR